MIIGITGSLACGKTTVSKFFLQFGFKLINADEIVHKLLDPRTRRNLRKIVIDDPGKLRKLEKLIHPPVLKEIKEKINQARKNNSNLIIDAPLLIETGLGRLVDFLIIVKADQATQIRRAKISLSLTKNEALQLIKRQMSLKDKIKLADFVVNNNGGLEDTKKQVKKIWDKIKQEER